MKHFTFTTVFQALYDKAVSAYAGGRRGADTFFTAEETAFLASNGISAQHLYDYAEDLNNHSLPDYGTAVGIELIRRDYFLNEQYARPTGRVLDESTLPPKSAAVRGVTWLPRLLPKARAKLLGELPPSLMYCCGGDRSFFEEHDIHPVEFLAQVWRHGDKDEAIVDWVIGRSSSARSATAVV